MNRRIVVSILVALALTALPAFAQSRTRLHADATSLAATLHDAQTSVNVSPSVWRVVGNEANSLANRIYGATAGNSTARGLATDLRTHVRMMRQAALAGNAVEARRHAAEAMPFLTRLIDWASPPRNLALPGNR
ncbi:MAG TPA: hypothetical protein VMS98_08325 [Thermoanaerobaculia bacterium]|nr:hypothetical protein [Thermoanaerobaculia bacterium]